MKKWLSILLALTMCLSLFSGIGLFAFADEAEEAAEEIVAPAPEPVAEPEPEPAPAPEPGPEPAAAPEPAPVEEPEAEPAAEEPVIGEPVAVEPAAVESAEEPEEEAAPAEEIVVIAAETVVAVEEADSVELDVDGASQEPPPGDPPDGKKAPSAEGEEPPAPPEEKTEETKTAETNSAAKSVELAKAELPESLTKVEGRKDATEIEKALKTEAKEETNIQVVEVRLVLADAEGNPLDKDGKKTDKEEEFVDLKEIDPAKGATFLLDFPNETLKKDFNKYEFTVLHMFAADGKGVDGKDHKAGEIEKLTPDKVDEKGLLVTVKSLSPFAISWTEKEAVAEEPTQNPAQGGTTPPPPPSDGTTPPPPPSDGTTPPPPPGGKPGDPPPGGKPGDPPPGGKPGDPPPGGKPGDPPPGGKPGDAPAADDAAAPAVYDQGELKIHAYDASGEMAYIVESDDALVGLGAPANPQAQEGWKEYVDSLDKPMEDIILTGPVDAGLVEGMTVYAIEDAKEAIEAGEGASGEPGAAFAKVDEVLSEDGVEIAGIEFKLVPNGDGYGIAIPAAKAIYVDAPGEDGRLIFADDGAKEAAIKSLEDLKDGEYELILVKSGTAIEIGKIDGAIEAIRNA